MLNGIWVVDRCHSDKQLSGIDDESIWLHHLTTILIYGERPKIKVPWLVIKHTACLQISKSLHKLRTKLPDI